MTALNGSTRRRLQKLQQIPSVWEGDRRPFSPGALASMDIDAGSEGECVLWVDGSQTMVRSMEVVLPDTGPETVVRTLLRAMEQPHSPARPARPQKIVVRDRELQFYLRGVLQDLGITVDYAPELPLIDEIFRGFQDMVDAHPPQVPPQYSDLLHRQSAAIWEDAPWDWLEEHQVLAVELNEWDLGTLYVSVMGMMAMEYGVLLYRSLESLKQFRQQVLTDPSLEQMEVAFLNQDCLFVTFEAQDDFEDEDEAFDLADLPAEDVTPTFGNLHPLEGLRSFLHEEEAIALSVALEALHRFFRQYEAPLTADSFAALSSRYRIPLPVMPEGFPTPKQQISVKVSTLPDVTLELLQMVDEEAEDEMPVLRDDLIPDNSLSWLGLVSWETVTSLTQTAKQASLNGKVAPKGDGLPVIFIQTSQPKAKTLIQGLLEAGGPQAVCFNVGRDPFSTEVYDLGLIQTSNEELHLFAEFMGDNPAYQATRKQWEQRCKKNQGRCGVIIAKGISGASRGNPQLKDILALYEVQAVEPESLGLGPLELRMMQD